MNLNPSTIEQGNMSSTINIYATIDGYVTKVNVSNGTYVSPSDVILEIVDTDHIHLELSVFEKDILKVKKDQKIIFKIPEASSETYHAEVHLVGTTIDEESRRVKVHGHVDAAKANFIVGMFVEAEIIIAQSKSMGLPKEAVITADDGYFALILEEKNEAGLHLKKTQLTIGKETEDFVEILNTDVLEQQQVIINGTSMLLNDSEGHSH
jgi:cobalt-zinc-cadmium efflux system membrane fusion protein